MATKKLDFPIHRDPTTRFLPWIIAFMIFLSILAMVGFLIMNKEVSHWQQDVDYQFSVLVPSVADSKQDQATVLKVIDALRGIDKVMSVSLVGQNDINQLLKPWFNDGNLLKDLPLPHLITVLASPDDPPSSKELAKVLNSITKNATVDDHSIWLAHIVTIFSSIRNGSLGILFLVLCAMVGTVVFTTRTGISVHEDVLKVLFLIGAENRYIATQFAYQATRLSIWGVVIGLIFSSPVFYFLWELNHMKAAMILTQIHIDKVFVMILILVPSILATLIARITAWWTVMLVLRKSSNT